MNNVTCYFKDANERRTHQYKEAYFHFTSTKINDNVFVFVEGDEDKRFYKSSNINDLFIKNHKKKFSNSIYYISCGCKRNVVKINDEINKIDKYRYRSRESIVDSDYNDNEDIPKTINVIPYYSIENYYLSSDNIDIFLKDMLGFDDQQTNDTKIFIKEVHKILMPYFIQSMDNVRTRRQDKYSLELNKLNPKTKMDICKYLKIKADIYLKETKKLSKDKYDYYYNHLSNLDNVRGKTMFDILDIYFTMKNLKRIGEVDYINKSNLIHVNIR